jgi:mRNA deadenylase 3'-5' endonuclease subunit Ccr4
MKKQKQKQKAGCKKSNRRKKGQQPATTDKSISSWVDKIDWITAAVEEDDASSNTETTKTDDPLKNSCTTNVVSILSWNVLADAYCSPRSHPHLPLTFQRHVFDRPQRQKAVRERLRRMAVSLAPDLLALQEVDPPLGIAACMNELGYDGVETTATPSSSSSSSGGKKDGAGRVDACALYYLRDQWRCVDHEIVRLDDLATLCSSSKSKSKSTTAAAATTDTADTTIATTTTTTNHNSRSNNHNCLQGVQASFLRKNMALLVRLEHLHTKRQLVVAVLHLYWNPVYEYVKVCMCVCDRSWSNCWMKRDISYIYILFHR